MSADASSAMESARRIASESVVAHVVFGGAACAQLCRLLRFFVAGERAESGGSVGGCGSSAMLLQCEDAMLDDDLQKIHP